MLSGVISFTRTSGSIYGKSKYRMLKDARRFLLRYRLAFGALLLMYVLFLACAYYEVVRHDMRELRHRHFRHGLSTIKYCVIDEHSWNSLTNSVNRCAQYSRQAKSRSMDEFMHDMGWTTSTFLKTNTTGPACSWLSLGSKNNIVRREFQTLYPECSILELMQLSKSDALAALRPESDLTSSESTLRLTNGTTQRRLLDFPFYPTLLREYLHRKRVSHLTLDLEGFEYAILQKLTQDREHVFCQIDVVLSSPNIQHAVMGDSFNFERFMGGFLINSSYVPVHASSYLEHIRVLFVNYNDHYCYKMLDYSAFSI